MAGSLLQERIDRLRIAGKAKNTLTAYEKAERYFAAWLGLVKGEELSYPIDQDVIVEFVVSHVEGLPVDVDLAMVQAGVKARMGLHSVGSIRSKVIGIGHFHKERGLSNPCRSDVINDILLSAQRMRAAAGMTKKKSMAITKPMLDRMIGKINTRTLEGKRDRAVLEFGFYTGGRRRSEIANAEFRFLTKVGGGWEYLLHRSKTDQAGKGAVKFLRARYAKGLETWLEAAGIRGGYLFRKLTPGGEVTESRLPGAEINSHIVKRYVSAIGEDADFFSAHGLRRGFITHCGRLGIPIFDVMQMTGHKDIRTVHAYYEEGKIGSNPATKL